MKFNWQKLCGYFILSAAYDVNVSIAKFQVPCSHCGKWLRIWHVSHTASTDLSRSVPSGTVTDWDTCGNLPCHDTRIQ
jgi:hypothetical protein